MFLNKIYDKIQLVKSRFLPTKKQKAHARWLLDNGEIKRLSYNLSNNSIVWDVGGFEGEFASSIASKYNCNVFIFEPVPKFCDLIKNKFLGNDKITLFPFGLSNFDGHIDFTIDGDASTSFKKTTSSVQLKVRDVSKFIEENNVLNIDLVKINIEGGEYNMLESLISSGHIKKFKNIQVQFHELDGRTLERYQKIVESLNDTHQRTWHYFFVWENWALNEVDEN